MNVLNTDIFFIDDIQSNGDSIQAKLSINKSSAIFNGHFPGQPIVPGACMVQMVKDVLETALILPLILKKADHLKFISMIVPENEDDITLDISYKIIEDQIFKITAKIVNSGSACFKFQGLFRVS